MGIEKQPIRRRSKESHTTDKGSTSDTEKEQPGGVGSGRVDSLPPALFGLLNRINARTPVRAAKEDVQRDNSGAGMGRSLHPLLWKSIGDLMNRQ